MKSIVLKNIPVANQIGELNTAKIALAMLCLGEASKYDPKTGRRFYLGNTDPRIIFIELLKRCFRFDMEKVRCTVQCRADQNTEKLERYWRRVTKIPKNCFISP